MKMKSRSIGFFAVLILLCVSLVTSALGEGLALAQPLAGETAFPEGSTEDNARFLLTYAYPQVVAQQETDNSINAFYADALEELTGFTAPFLFEEAGEGADAGVPGYLNINYQVTANTEDFFSVILTQEQFMGAAAAQTMTANVFARHGDGAGGIAMLPDVLGIAPEDEVGATNATDTVYNLVWEIITEQIQTGTVEYFEDLTKEDLLAEFFPETDFYLDEQGNLVFFIQPGMIASEAAGPLTFPFAPAELDSEMPQG
jgi:hypothetical protein